VDGASSLELSVLHNFVAHDLTSAMEDLKARVEDLNEHHPEVVHDAAKAGAMLAIIETALGYAHDAAAHAGAEFLKIAIPLVRELHLVVDLADAVFQAYYQHILSENVVQALKRVERTLDI
jgi:hypothetical protein